MFNLNQLPTPMPLSSYSKEDVIFLLKDLGSQIEEQRTRVREERIQKGVHYSEMLPLEEALSKEYYQLFYDSLLRYQKDLAHYIGNLCHKLIASKGQNIVLVSLARAGTPIGILMKRSIQAYYQIDVPHYSISIIIDKGLDENALKYILAKHPSLSLQFVDGWTGKGTIKKVLTTSLSNFNKKYQTTLESSLSVLADPCDCAEFSGTSNDFLIPSSLLNSTVSGLISRSILRDDLVGAQDFHGVKYYTENKEEDVSNFFLDSVSPFFSLNSPLPLEISNPSTQNQLTWKGLYEAESLQKIFTVQNINHIKPGIGETTRVLLRRVPWKILVHNFEDSDILHILQLAKDKNVPVEQYFLKNYRCVGIIKNLGDAS